VWALAWHTTGLNGHEVGKVFATYPHSLGAVTPNMIIIYSCIVQLYLLDLVLDLVGT